MAGLLCICLPGGICRGLDHLDDLDCDLFDVWRFVVTVAAATRALSLLLAVACTICDIYMYIPRWVSSVAQWLFDCVRVLFLYNVAAVSVLSPKLCLVKRCQIGQL